MLSTIVAAGLTLALIISFCFAYDEAKKAGYVSREYIYGSDKEKTPNAVTSDVKSTGR